MATRSTTMDLLLVQIKAPFAPLLHAPNTACDASTADGLAFPTDDSPLATDVVAFDTDVAAVKTDIEIV